MLVQKANHTPTNTQVILIISDQDDTPVLWETLFQQKGYITVWENHENALQTCKDVSPALIIIDTHLSHFKRLALCSGLRAITSGVILLLTSDFNGGQMIDIYNVGVDECLLKPVSPAFLVIKSISWLLQQRWIGYSSGLPQAHLSTYTTYK